MSQVLKENRKKVYEKKTERPSTKRKRKDHPRKENRKKLNEKKTERTFAKRKQKEHL